MTTEEKARAYDEALEKARMYRDNAKAVEEYAAVARYENIFPVLRESEDERIKNLIYCIVRDRSDVGKLLEANGCPVEKALSWIEKQKEQKPVDYDHEMWKNCEVNFEGGKKEVIEHPEKYGLQKEQKSAEQDYDNRIQYDSVKSGIEAFASTYSFNIESKLFPQLTKEQQQLWREEIEQAVIAGGESGIELVRDNRYKENRTIDWSEENEKILNELLDHCNTENATWYNWLKSLRPSWKPSEEQMRCLCEVVDEAIRKHNESVGGYKPARVLKSLYEQLQKLGMKEEPEYYQHFDPDC